MLNQTTLAQLRSLKLMGLVAALEEQATQPGIQALSFDERLALIVDREMLVRDERKRPAVPRGKRIFSLGWRHALAAATRRCGCWATPAISPACP